jgi:hypothetical protein
MAQPFDYTIASPTAAFQQSYAFGQAMSQQDAARAEAAAKAKRTQEAKAALQSIAQDRTPENIAKNLLMFPELKEQVTASESILSDAEKTSANQLRAEVLSLYKAGKTDLARARLETQLNAYKNTPGKEKEAKAAETLLKTFDIDADSVIVPMSIQLAQSDDKLYKALFDTAELTSFQKDLMAAGIDPKSPRGITLSENFVSNKADPWIETEVINPAGQRVMFKGPQSVYMQNYGNQTPAGSSNNAPKVGDVRGNYRYAGGDPANKNNWIKIEGGQTGTPAPSGNFR